MRTITLAVGLIAVGTLAALPFRRIERPLDPDAPTGIATGPLGRQLPNESIDSAIPWPSRPAFEPALTWQPQPMRFEAVPPSFAMPPMPDSYPLDAIELPMPAPVRSRYDAVASLRVPEQVAESNPGLPTSAVALVEDRFVFPPLPTPATTTPYRAAKLQAASVINNETAPAERQYIREPQ